MPPAHPVQEELEVTKVEKKAPAENPPKKARPGLSFTHAQNGKL